MNKQTTFDPHAFPKKLNMGCGFDRREGYLNVDFQDFHEPDLVADARSLPMLPNGFYDEVLAQDVLEHLERDDIEPTLAEWARIIAEGGTLILRVPDVIGVARSLSLAHSIEHQNQLLQNLYGTQAYKGDYHLSGFTEISLRTQLHAAGFVVESMERRDGWLFDCVATRRSDPGKLDLGPIPFMALCDHPATMGPAVRLGPVDRVVAGIGSRVPAGPRAVAQRAWRPLRKRLAQRRIL